MQPAAHREQRLPGRKPHSSAGWVNLNAGFGTAEFYPGIGIDPANIARAFGGTQDNGTLQYSGSLGWTYAGVCGDGFATAINPTSPNIVYAACNGGFFESVTGGAPGTWTQVSLPAALRIHLSRWIRRRRMFSICTSFRKPRVAKRYFKASTAQIPGNRSDRHLSTLSLP